VLYTASSDRTVRIWDAEQGRAIHTLKDHGHWVTTLTLNTDFVLRTGPYDHTGTRPSSDEQGEYLARICYGLILEHNWTQPKNLRKQGLITFWRRRQSCLFLAQTTIRSSSGHLSHLPSTEPDLQSSRLRV